MSSIRSLAAPTLGTLALASWLALVPTANAAVFTDPALFAAATPGLVTDDFESSTFDGTTITFGAGTITCSGGNFCNTFFGNEFGGVPPLALSGTKAPFFGTPDTLTFSFLAPITAFGIYIGGAGDVGIQTLTASLSNGDAFTVLDNYTNASGDFDGNTNFFGVSGASPFTSISFTGADIDDGVFFDDMSFQPANAVPIPATPLLVLAGLAALAFVRRRRG
jgi:hypothetical protein